MLGFLMAVSSYGIKLIPFCDSQGLTEVRRLRRVENHFHSLDWKAVDNWIDVKESELKDESVYIARKALSNSRLATNIATMAMVLSTIMAIQKIIELYSH